MDNLLAIISRIRKLSNNLIIEELDRNGIRGVVPSHGDILHVLYRDRRCKMNELAKKIHRTKPTVSVLVNKLIAAGLIQKVPCPDDARVSYIELTDKCQKLMPEVSQISKKLNTTLLSGFTMSETEELKDYLERILHNME